jgi:hypothetical protein
MPPTGGIRTSLSWRISQGPLGPAVTDAIFSPGQPLLPPDQEPVRVWDFPVGVNTTITPRAAEPFGFAHLRAFSNVELVRLAIETRKDQLESLHWRLNPREGVAATPALTARHQQLTQFWRRPDGVHPFASWLRLAIEDLLAIDAPAFEKRRDRAGRLIGLDVVPGDTIKLLVDETGRTPAPPLPAYQQIIKGRVWADLTTDDLLYAPRNRRPNHVLGFSPVEQIVVTIQTIVNRQAAQLAYFTEGNAPLGFLTAPEGWGPSQIRELQLWLNAQLAGQASERAKLIWTPAGADYKSLKDPPLKDDFDEWLARIVAFAFSLPPTPFVRQMNRATAGELGVEPEQPGRGPRAAESVGQAPGRRRQRVRIRRNRPRIRLARPGRGRSQRPVRHRRQGPAKRLGHHQRNPRPPRPAPGGRRRHAPRLRRDGGAAADWRRSP